MKSRSFGLVFLALLIGLEIKAQELLPTDQLNSACPVVDEGYFTTLSYFTMEMFLKDGITEDYRKQSGTEGVPYSQVRPIEDSEACDRISLLIRNNEIYRRVDDLPDLRKFYFQTDDFYYAFWRWKNENRWGGKKLFIVIKKSDMQDFYYSL